MKKLVKFCIVLSLFLNVCLFANAKTDFPTTIDSRIKTIVYNPNEIVELTFHYGFQSFIELEDDEEIDIISLGESFPWKITPIGKRLFIRPLQINTSTNMTLITNKRTYMFQLKSDSYEGKGDEELIYSVRFYYPTTDDKIPSMSNAKYTDLTSINPMSEEDEQNVLKNFKRGTVLNFDYAMTGSNRGIKLKKAFDDGISTYFEFGDQNIITVINYVDADGNETTLKYFRDGPYIVVSAVKMQFSLRVTGEVLCVFNNTMLY